ncbi:hypothetical protein [Cupriavidus basilensis]|uniref:hypothetical protein n=1 Tax=Cupriavidus basilensis TaxID=68895 RepID=UPI0039F71AB0
MRAGQANGSEVRKVCLFANVHRALQFAFEVAATREAIKTPSYDEPTAGGTGEKVARNDLVGQAAFVMQATRQALTPDLLAHVTCTHDGAGEARRAALATLCAEHAHIHKNAGLLRACWGREYEFGETWCESLPAIAIANGCGQTTAETVARKVRRATVELERYATQALHAAFVAKGWIPHYSRG